MELIIVLSRFEYDVNKARYGLKAHLLFTDTGSAMSQIETPDIYKDMVEMSAFRRVLLRTHQPELSIGLGGE